MAALTQLTALHGRSMMLSPEFNEYRTLSADTPGVLDLLSSMTGAVPSALCHVLLSSELSSEHTTDCLMVA